MWIATYDRHHMYILGRSSVFKSKRFLPAWLVYQWWTICFMVSWYQVKQVSLYQSENGIVFFEGMRKRSIRADQMRKLKGGSKPKRRFWDFS